MFPYLHYLCRVSVWWNALHSAPFILCVWHASALSFNCSFYGKKIGWETNQEKNELTKQHQQRNTAPFLLHFSMWWVEWRKKRQRKRKKCMQPKIEDDVKSKSSLVILWFCFIPIHTHTHILIHRRGWHSRARIHSNKCYHKISNKFIFFCCVFVLFFGVFLFRIK